MTFLLSGAYARTAPHICGLVAGIFIGCFISERFQAPGGMPVNLSPHERTTKNIGYGFTIGLAVLFITVALL